MGWQVCPDTAAAANRAFTVAASALLSMEHLEMPLIQLKAKVQSWFTAVIQIRARKPSLLNPSLTQLHQMMENGKPPL